VVVLRTSLAFGRGAVRPSAAPRRHAASRAPGVVSGPLGSGPGCLRGSGRVVGGFLSLAHPGLALSPSPHPPALFFPHMTQTTPPPTTKHPTPPTPHPHPPPPPQHPSHFDRLGMRSHRRPHHDKIHQNQPHTNPQPTPPHAHKTPFHSSTREQMQMLTQVREKAWSGLRLWGNPAGVQNERHFLETRIIRSPRISGSRVNVNVESHTGTVQNVLAYLQAKTRRIRHYRRAHRPIWPGYRLRLRLADRPDSSGCGRQRVRNRGSSGVGASFSREEGAASTRHSRHVVSRVKSLACSVQPHG